MEAQENKELDWIEKIVGKKPVMMKPGIYTKEVDLSAIVPAFKFSKEEEVEMLKNYYGDQLWFKRSEE